jgi:arsenical pump membrane protein
MEANAVAAIMIFLAVLVLLILRPRNLNIALIASVGAIAALLLGVVTVIDALNALLRIWDAALAFIGIVTMSVTLDFMGFFRWIALRIAKMAGGDGLKLYIYTVILTAMVSILFANDSCVLILTPIVLEMVSAMGLTGDSRAAYLFGAGLIADTAAMPLITSNPVNIVSADYFHYTFVQHFLFMGPVAAATIPASIGIVYLFFRKKIPRTYSVNKINDLIESCPRPLRLRGSVGVLVAIDIGYVFASFIGIPVSFIICSGAAVLVIMYATGYKQNQNFCAGKVGVRNIMKRVNWDILFFMISIYLVVDGLRSAGAISFFSNLFASSVKLPGLLSTFVPSLIVTLGASAMNNWSMTMMGLISIGSILPSLTAKSATSLIFSNIIGNNLGPHFFPLGSLAMLMWLGTMKRKGVTIRIRDYFKVGAVLSLAEVLIASLILWLEVAFLGMVLVL